MKLSERLRWLTEDDPGRLEELWRLADEARRDHVGEAVHLRGLVEFSNRCRRNCLYCGLRRANRRVERYCMTADEILACARQAERLALGTVVLQSGEDPLMTADWLAGVIERIKSETDLAVTLSVGEWPREAYAQWRRAGADRFLMRFETSNPELYGRLHPDTAGGLATRLEALAMLRELDYELGSGVLVGAPGQTFDDLAADLGLFKDLGLHMVGIGPYIAHVDTPLGRGELPAAPVGQAPSSELMGSKMVALTRLTCPETNIPATTALATISPGAGRSHGLQRGANVVMPNLTPARYKALYSIYPGKAGVNVEITEAIDEVRRTVEAMGRTIGLGRGDSPAYRRGHPQTKMSEV